MRNLVQPLQSLTCKLCDGELRFKRIESIDPVFDADVEIFVCAKCGQAHARNKIADPYAARAARRASRGADQPGGAGGDGYA
jgi:hypothetical protein